MMTICRNCGKKWCGKNCNPDTCDFRFICIKSAKIDFCPTCQVNMLEEFEKQVIRKLIPRKLRLVEGNK